MSRRDVQAVRVSVVVGGRAVTTTRTITTTSTAGISYLDPRDSLKHTRDAHCTNFTQRRCRVRRPNTIMAHFGRLSTRERETTPRNLTRSLFVTTRDESCGNALGFTTPFSIIARTTLLQGTIFRVYLQQTTIHVRWQVPTDGVLRIVRTERTRILPKRDSVVAPSFGSVAATSSQPPINQALDYR